MAPLHEPYAKPDTRVITTEPVALLQGSGSSTEDPEPGDDWGDDGWDAKQTGASTFDDEEENKTIWDD